MQNGTPLPYLEWLFSLDLYSNARAPHIRSRITRTQVTFASHKLQQPTHKHSPNPLLTPDRCGYLGMPAQRIGLFTDLCVFGASCSDHTLVGRQQSSVAHHRTCIDTPIGGRAGSSS